MQEIPLALVLLSCLPKIPKSTCPPCTANLLYAIARWAIAIWLTYIRSNTNRMWLTARHRVSLVCVCVCVCMNWQFFSSSSPIHFIHHLYFCMDSNGYYYGVAFAIAVWHFVWVLELSYSDCRLGDVYCAQIGWLTFISSEMWNSVWPEFQQSDQWCADNTHTVGSIERTRTFEHRNSGMIWGNRCWRI